ncbi:MAG TPA: response regulator [Candidatus Binatia bacterium]|nr:response regulator [Candidatus Binatia bacterium]
MSEKILIVEDHHATRKNVSRFLQSQGYSVLEASDGYEALNRLNEDSVDIVISDFVLPKIHGLALVREIRSRWPAIGVIIMSAYLGQEAGKVILEREAEFVAKPLQLSHLAATVYGVLLRKRMNNC